MVIFQDGETKITGTSQVFNFWAELMNFGRLPI